MLNTITAVAAGLNAITSSMPPIRTCRPPRLRHDREARGRGELVTRRRQSRRAQIKRFLILHKELDADDGELTRTQKVRRGFIADRYAPLINALYDGSKEADISTEVTFEDGRKGVISARVKIRDMQTEPLAPVEKAA